MPVRKYTEKSVVQEMTEIVELVKRTIPLFGIDAIVRNKKIVYVNSGDLIALQAAASGPLRELSVVEIDKPADLVFVSLW